MCQYSIFLNSRCYFFSIALNHAADVQLHCDFVSIVRKIQYVAGLVNSFLEQEAIEKTLCGAPSLSSVLSPSWSIHFCVRPGVL